MGVENIKGFRFMPFYYTPSWVGLSIFKQFAPKI